MDDYKNKLIEKYTEAFSKTENKPEWAVKKKSNINELIHPPIPFIGDNYNEKKVLLYASAENLTHYINSDKETEYYENDNEAIDRHSLFYELYKDKENYFFPYVHIAPVNNGALLNIAGYILHKIFNSNFNNPYQLVKNLAIANFGKFSINTKTNKDYASNFKYLKFSFEFVKADLEILKPEIIIIPKSIYYKSKKIIKEIVPAAKILPIYQITGCTINCSIHRKYKEKEKSLLPGWLVKWHENLPTFPEKYRISGKTKNNFYSVYSYLDEFKILNDKKNN